MKKYLVIGGGVIFVAVIAFAVHFYFFQEEVTVADLIIKRDRLKGEISITTNNLNNAKAKLGSMNNNLRRNFALGASVQDQMKQATEMVAQTDFMFTNPDGTTPSLFVKSDTTDEAAINAKRKEINLLIEEWKKKSDILSIEEIGVAESEEVKKGMEKIEAFIDDLHKILENLTPENSQFTQTQINNFSSWLPSVEAVTQVFAAVETAIQTAKTTTPEAPTQPVTPTEVAAQQQVVVETQAQLDTLQDQLDQLDEQIQQLSPTTPPPTPPQTDNYNSGQENMVNDSYLQGGKPKGIIVQPGPPRLIEGANYY